MFVLYAASLAWGILGMLVALALINVKSALEAWWILSSIFSGGMLGLFLLGYFLPKATRLSAALGMISGILVITWMSLSESSFWNNHPALRAFRSPFHNFLVVVLGTLAIFFGRLARQRFHSKKTGHAEQGTQSGVKGARRSRKSFFAPDTKTPKTANWRFQIERRLELDL